MGGIEVQLIDQGPATFEVRVRTRDGEEQLLPRDHPDVLEIEELAYGRVLSAEVRPLPAGTIRVRVPLDERGVPEEGDVGQGRALGPWVEDVADEVARRILA
jgi:hypothetical protein